MNSPSLVLILEKYCAKGKTNYWEQKNKNLIKFHYVKFKKDGLIQI